MKYIKYLNSAFCLSLFFSLPLFLVSCSETKDNTDPPYVPPIVTEEGYKTITLAVDNDEIPSDGTMTATFTVTANNGDDLTRDAIISKDGTPITGFSFISETDGTYKFTATYFDETTEKTLTSNEVEVKVFTHEIPVGKLTLIPANSTLIADNRSTVSFRVELDGEDVTAESRLGSETFGLYIDPDDEGNLTWRSRETGTQKFFGYYNGLRSANESIEAIPLQGQVYFYKQAAFFKFTSWTCAPCYLYTQYLDVAYQNYPDRIVEVAIHGNLHPNNPDPYTPSDFNTLKNTLCLASGGMSFPYTTIDLWDNLSYAGAAGSDDIERYFRTAVEKYPATIGFEVESSVTGNQANVTITAKSSLIDRYTLGVILMEDNLENTQSGTSGTIQHNKVYRSMATSVKGDDLGLLDTDDTATRSYTFDLTGYNPENCKLMIYSTYNRLNGKTIVNNATYADLNGKLLFRYEE